jgi:hypothetical protein
MNAAPPHPLLSAAKRLRAFTALCGIYPSDSEVERREEDDSEGLALSGDEGVADRGDRVDRRDSGLSRHIRRVGARAPCRRKTTRHGAGRAIRGRVEVLGRELSHWRHGPRRSTNEPWNRLCRAYAVPTALTAAAHR